MQTPGLWPRAADCGDCWCRYVPQAGSGGIVADVSVYPCPPFRDHVFRGAVVEHAMRCCRSEIVVAMVLDAPLASARMAQAVGQLLDTSNVRLLNGSPLLAALGADTHIDPAWRRWYPPGPGSLFAQLESLRLLTTVDGPFTDPLDEWSARTADLAV